MTTQRLSPLLVRYVADERSILVLSWAIHRSMWGSFVQCCQSETAEPETTRLRKRKRCTSAAEKLLAHAVRAFTIG